MTGVMEDLFSEWGVFIEVGDEVGDRLPGAADVVHGFLQELTALRTARGLLQLMPSFHHDPCEGLIYAGVFLTSLLTPCFSKEVCASITLSSVPFCRNSRGEPAITVGAKADVVGALHDELVVAGVEFVHGHEQFHVFEVDCELAHINQLIFGCEVTGGVKEEKALDEHTLDVVEGFPDGVLARVGLHIHVPCTIEFLESDVNVKNVRFF